MVKSRSRKKRCSFQGCRKMAVDDYNCSLHAVAKEAAAEEKVALGQRIKGTANKINRVRDAVGPDDLMSGKDVFNAICFKAGSILGKVGAYLEGK